MFGLFENSNKSFVGIVTIGMSGKSDKLDKKLNWNGKTCRIK